MPATIKDLSDNQLIRKIEILDSKERELTLTVLLHLAEIDRRRLYIKRGYSSFFDFCVRHLKYSDSAAGRRIRAARCIREYPQVGRMLERRELNIVTISRIYGIITRKNMKHLLREVARKRARDVDLVLSRYRPTDRIFEKVKPVYVLAVENKVSHGDMHPRNLHFRGSPDAITDTHNSLYGQGGKSSTATGGGQNSCTFSIGDPGRRTQPANPQGDPGSEELIKRKMLTQKLKYKLEFGIDPELMKKIEKVRMLLSTKYPGNLGLEQLLEELVDEYLKRHCPQARQARRERRLSAKQLNQREQQLSAKQIMSTARSKTTKPNGGEHIDSRSCGGDSNIDAISCGGDPKLKNSRNDNKPDTTFQEENGPVPDKITKRENNLMRDMTGRQNHDYPPDPTGKRDNHPPDPTGKHDHDYITSSRSRHIPQHIRDEVYLRDGGKCTFVGPDGNRCGSKWKLQIDHIVPFSCGGDHSPGNLRLLCAKHNRLEAERLLGTDLMKKFARRERPERNHESFNNRTSDPPCK